MPARARSGSSGVESQLSWFRTAASADSYVGRGSDWNHRRAGRFGTIGRRSLTGRGCVKTHPKFEFEGLLIPPCPEIIEYNVIRAVDFSRTRLSRHIHTALYGHRPVCQADFDVVPQQGTGCSLIFGLDMQAEACGP